MQPQSSFAADELALQHSAEAWLPTHDPQAKLQILAYLQRAAAAGGEPITDLCAALDAWFGPGAGAALPLTRQPGLAAAADRLASEALVPLRPPALWPQRPKRFAGELFSSWLWRLAGAMQIAPAKFIRDVLGVRLTDIDRDIAPATLERLAQRTGQTFRHLAAGTICPAFDAADDRSEAGIEAVLLHDGRFLRQRGDNSHRNKRLHLLHFCPLCLKADKQPYFRRMWRFSLDIVCLEHGCLLHDGCRQCGAPIDLLAQPKGKARPRCTSCGTSLRDSKTVPAPELTIMQDRLHAMLLYLGTCMPRTEHGVHVDALRAALHANASITVNARADYFVALQPGKVEKWFGKPVRAEHAKPLRWLAQGVPYDLVITIRNRAKRSSSAVRAKPQPHTSLP